MTGDTQATNREILQDRDYPYIRAWGIKLGSFPHYVAEQVRAARADNAPADAVYRRSEYGEQPGTWATFPEIRSQDTRQRIAELTARIAQGLPIWG